MLFLRNINFVFLPVHTKKIMKDKLKSTTSYFKNERKKEKVSKTTGSGLGEVYVSRWVHITSLRWLDDAKKDLEIVADSANNQVFL